MSAHFLSQLFEPTSVAVIGASNSNHSVGMKVFKNMLESGFKGALYAINPKHKSVQHQPCFSTIGDIDDTIDLAIITTPANTIPKIITECGNKGVHYVIILSSGFSESGAAGKVLEHHLVNIAKGYHMHLVGPNCLGIMRPSIQMNATFDNTFAQPGHLAFVSPSGALTAGILDWAADKKIGFSTVISLGNSVDVDFADVLDYLAVDPKTESILMYIEGIHDSRKFMSALRATARMKPVIVIKGGRYPMGTRAAMSHTGALIGDDDVFDVALRRAGAVRVMTIEELFLAAEILRSHYRVNGNKLLIVANSGSAGMLAADRAADLNIPLSILTENTISELDKLLPKQWSRQNPVDILGDATSERYQRVLEICAKDENIDGILAMLVPVAMSSPLKIAETLVENTNKSKQTVLACWMGEKNVKSSWHIFANHQVPYFDTPEKAIQAFSYLADYHLNQQLLLQVPEPLSPQAKSDIAFARYIIDKALSEKRTILTGVESKALLNAFCIPTTQTIIAANKEEALLASQSLGYPVAMKIHSPHISHKQDIGGVMLHVSNHDAVSVAFDKLISNAKQAVPEAIILGVTVEPMFKNTNDRELLIGVLRDIVFGPVISFGAGGTLVEIMKDRTLALPPLNAFIAKQLIEQTRIAKLLGKFRNMPAVNLDLLVKILLHVSEMVCEIPEIEEMDINPLIINDQKAAVVDARIVIQPYTTSKKPYTHMAIHPYPEHLISFYNLENGSNIAIRPIRPEDALMIQVFVRNLSSQSKYFRFMQHIRELNPETLVRLTQIDYDREMTFVATYVDNDREKCIGVSHYITNPDRESCEFAIAVADDWQNKGVGSKLMKSLCNEAKAQGLSTIKGVVLATNTAMLEMTHHLGFEAMSSEDPTITMIVKNL